MYGSIRTGIRPAIQVLIALLMIAGCAGKTDKVVKKADSYTDLKNRIIGEYSSDNPKAWGENIEGVVKRFLTEKKEIALTFDTCGGPKGSAYDSVLIDYLTSQKIPATLFINSRWIDSNPDIFMALVSNPLFEIENHGLLHRPCSADGRSAYNIKGTANIGEMVDEMEIAAMKIESLTGRKPLFYRPGTASCDDICVSVAGELGYMIAGFSINGDSGATATAAQVKSRILSARAGDMILMHMNHPESATAEGVMEALPELRKQGYSFIKLGDVKAWE
jgi:peptidoglycan/xylan/chitin deacetylase (PgdA/CDA1 family)